MSDSPTLKGRRILVVGASAGIGAAFARHAARDGAEVVVTARRLDKLEELVSELGRGHAIAGDVTDTDVCSAMVGSAVERLGGLDLVLYTAGIGVLVPLAEADADVWRRTYEVNVVGPAAVAQAALRHLAPEGVISFISSESADEIRWGLGTYAASKSALDTAIRYWRHEHPDRRFQRVIMGATMPTDFGTNLGDTYLAQAFEHWDKAGIHMGAMETDDVGRHLAEFLAVVMAHPEIDVPDVYLDARAPR